MPAHQTLLLPVPAIQYFSLYVPHRLPRHLLLGVGQPAAPGLREGGGETTGQRRDQPHDEDRGRQPVHLQQVQQQRSDRPEPFIKSTIWSRWFVW